MSETFDPYHKWLGIPAEEQPPNYYRLLGIPLFEGDPDVIDSASSRQMAHVRTYQSGKYGQLSQKILNEISRARVTLLHAQAKAEYDAKLARALPPSKTLPRPIAEWPEGKPPATAGDLRECLLPVEIVSRQEYEAALKSLSDQGKPTDAKHLAQELVKAGRMTKFQAAAALQGRQRSLLLGEYLVLEKIGQGGMGQVLKARHRRMRRVVALKIMSAAGMKQPDSVKRFLREVRAAARLNHPNIVTAFDANDVDGVHFLAMEYVDGKDLATVVQEVGRLSVAKAVDCIVQAARGLNFAHEHGVVHRDIKPANLLQDKNGIVKILDMGLAQFEEPLGDIKTAGLTQSGTIVGTVDYMAPEQAFDTHGASAKSDIYSLGCTLYYLLTGQSPARGSTLMQKLLDHREGKVPSLRELRSDIPASVDAVFQRMVAKDPEHRYATCQEAADALQLALQGAAKPPAARVVVPPQVSMDDDPELGFSVVAEEEEADSGLFRFMQSMQNVSLLKPAKTSSATAANPASAVRPLSGAKSVSTIAQASRIKTVPMKYWLALGSIGVVAIVLLGVAISQVLSSSQNKDKVVDKPSKNSSSGEVRVEVIPVNVEGATPSLSHALLFDGNDYVEIPTPKLQSGEPRTIEFWFFDWQEDGRQCIFDMMGDNSRLYAALFTPRKKGKSTCNVIAKPPGSKQMSSWTCELTSPKALRHVAIVLTEGKSTSAMFLDGKRISGPARGRTMNYPRTGGLLLGARRIDDGSLAEFFKGRLLGLRVSKSVRYSGNFLPSKEFGNDNDTLALYRFDEGAGEVLKDWSGNKHHGKIVGAQWVKFTKEDVKEPEEPVMAEAEINEDDPSRSEAMEARPAIKVEPPPIAKGNFNSATAQAYQQQWADYLAENARQENSIGMRLALIPPGEFMMGSSDSEKDRREDEHRHEVEIKRPFFIGVDEVSNREYRRVMSSEHPEDDLPVGSITHQEALEFCEKLSNMPNELAANRRYRLPAEKEWEYACRAGTAAPFHFGNKLDKKQAAIYDSERKNIGSHSPNQFGLHNMHGNHAEWCADPYVEKNELLPAQEVRSGLGSTKGFNVRGGSFMLPADKARSARRMSIKDKQEDVGFRVVCEIDRKGGFERVFIGQSLIGWKIMHGEQGDWVVEDGNITAKRNRGWLALHNKLYRDCVLRLRWRARPGTDTGVFLRIPPRSSGEFPSAALEVQLSDDKYFEDEITPPPITGSVVRRIPVSARTFRGANNWNDLAITCKGNRISVSSNGLLLIDDESVEKSGEPEVAAEGLIGLQTLGGGGEFRDIFVKQLDGEGSSR